MQTRIYLARNVPSYTNGPFLGGRGKLLAYAQLRDLMKGSRQSDVGGKMGCGHVGCRQAGRQANLECVAHEQFWG